MPCKHLPKTDLIHREEMRPLRHGGSHFVNAFWHGDQDDSDVTSCCAVTTRWHCQKQTALIADRSFWLIVVCFYGFQCNSSAVCESLKGFFCDLQTAWRMVLSMKPWSYIWLEFGLFSTIIFIYIVLHVSQQSGRGWFIAGWRRGTL